MPTFLFSQPIHMKYMLHNPGEWGMESKNGVHVGTGFAICMFPDQLLAG